MRVPLNCLIVAAWLWLASLGGRRRRYAFARRSYKFKGAIPHAGVAEGVAWKTVSVIEYVPNSSEFPSWRNFMLLFIGRYRVWQLRVIAVKRFRTKAEALQFAKGQS